MAATDTVFEPNTPLTEFGKGDVAESILGRMLVIQFDRNDSRVTQGRIAGAWVNVDEPDTLRLDLDGMMAFIPDPLEPHKGVWRCEPKPTRSLRLRNGEVGRHDTSVHMDHDGNIRLTLMEQGLRLSITGPDTNHPVPEPYIHPSSAS